jgi:hypothetical protein
LIISIYADEVFIHLKLVRRSLNEEQRCKGCSVFGGLSAGVRDGSDLPTPFVRLSHQWLDSQSCFLSHSLESVGEPPEKVQHFLKTRETCTDQLAIDGINHLDTPAVS